MHNLNYQKEVKRTMGMPTDFKASLCNWSLGLSGETGEVVEHIKKYVFHEKELDIDAVEKELGDVLWYLTALINDLDLSLDSVMTKNVEKLRKRYPEGFKKVKKVCS